MTCTTTRQLPWRGGRLLALVLTLASLAGLALAATPGVAQAAPTVVTISFDDGVADQYGALPILNAYGMHATFYINSAEVGTSGYYMNWSQIHDIAAAGNEIGGHTLHHPDLQTVTSAVATQEICDDRTALVNQGFDVTSFAYPYGHTSSAIESIVQGCGYSSARGVTGIVSPGGCTFNANDCPYAESFPPADRFLTRTPENADTTTSLATLQGYVTQAEQHGGGYVQIVIHHLCDTGQCDEYSTPPATLNNLLAWLAPRAASGTVVKTTAQALATASTDVTAPTVAVTAPANGASVSDTVTLTATASDNVGVSRVEFYRDDVLVGTDAASPFSVSWDSNTIANGTHTITARAYDAAGNETTSAARTLTVANAVSHETIVSLGFDDGDADQYSVRSLLAAHGMKATFYINSGRVGATSYMTKDQILDLQADGNEIAGHTVTHADLPTLDTDEQTRQICNDRVALLNMGFPVRSFAYPYGDYNAATESIAAACGYNSARTIGGLVTPTSCSGCAYAETLPALDAYSMRTPDSIKSTTTLAQMQGYVLQAEGHGGGLVPIVMHHVDTNCVDDYCVSPVLLDQFLTWLQARDASGTHVALMGDLVGGALKPGVAGPPSPPAASGPNLLQNPSLEIDANNDLMPDCWQKGGYGTNTSSMTRTTDPHEGSFGELLTTTSFTDGDNRLITKQDLGTCAPGVTPGRTYNLTAWYKSSGNARLVIYTRNAAGSWVFFAQQPAALPAATVWTKTTMTTAAIPAGITALSIGMSLRSVGSVSVDDFDLADTDQTAPTVSLTSPADGSTVTGDVPLTANAADASGITRVDFLVNGVVVGSSTSAPFSSSWDSRGINGTASIAARATDAAGNVTTSSSSLVTASNVVADTTAPVSSATCDTAACGPWYASAPLVALSATDAGSGVAEIVYTTDGSEPTLSNGTVYSTPFAIGTSTNVRFRAYDVAGNIEAVNSIDVGIDGDAPTASASCGGATCDGAWTGLPVSVALTGDDTGSGLDRIVYTLDGSAPSAANGTVYVASFSVLATSTVRYRAIDKAGNMSEIGSASVRIDTVAPVTAVSCDGGACGADWSTGPVSVTLSATDADSGVARTVYTMDGSDPTLASSEATGPIAVTSTTQLRYRSYDQAGNAEAVSTLAVSIDATAPVTTVSCNGAACDPATTYTAPLTLTLAATDAGSGVVSIRYTTDGSTPTAGTGTAYTGPLALAANTTLSYRSFDVAGNAEAPQTVALLVTPAPVDSTPPVTTATCTGADCASWHTGPTSVTLAATDDMSGVASIRYTTNGSVPTATNGTTYSAPIAIATTTGLQFRSYDVTGNAEAVQSVSIRVDSTLPVATARCGTLTCPTAWSKTALAVTLSATDSGSGVSQIRYTTDGSTPTATTGSVYTAAVAIDASATLRFRAIDVAGNAGTVVVLPLKVDADLPTAAATCNGGGCAAAAYASPLSVVLTAADAGSGVASIRYTTNGTDPTATSTTYSRALSVIGTAQIRFRAYDTAGNAGAVTRLALTIDKTAPVSAVTCNGAACSTGWYTSTQSVTLSATDSGSGVARIVYTTNGTTPTATNGQTYASPLSVSTSTTIAFIAIDGVDNKSAVRSVALKVDSAAPTVTLTAPSGSITGTVRVTGTATDDQGVSLITWYLDGRAQRSVRTSPFSFSWYTRTATKGTHTVSVRATDAAGNVGQSASATVTVH